MIEIKNLHKEFGSNEVLRGVNLDVARGTSMVVIGGSGSGKSVLVKSILGLLTPTSGSIKIDGVELVGASRRKRRSIDARIGMLFQHSALFDSLPIWENVAFRARQFGGASEAEAREIAADNLARVDLSPDLLDALPSELAGGSAKRVGLARAIAPDAPLAAGGSTPDILIFDEPTTGLDPIMTDVINHLIRECVAELNATTITITHDMSSVLAIADTTALLYRGEIIWCGGQEELRANSQTANPYLYQFTNGFPDGPIQLVE